ncbi:lysine--tRNA ligase [Patescibacteria group bacterium]|nr:lysine--tRNA ligase [Patescibacteria group bacterium]
MYDEMRSERLRKLQLLQDAGMEAYPVASDRSSSNADFLKEFEALVGSSAQKTLAGRVMSVRGQGGIIFADVFDGTARVQFVFEKTEVGDAAFDLFEKAVDQGDFVEAEGGAYLTKRGQQSLKVISWKMLAKSLSPLPTEWYGIQDPELKLRERYLDILLNEDLRDMFIRRGKFWQTIRTFLLDRGFLEVETPVLENSPGGADARPFITHHNALDMDVYLRISAGELWQKRLLVAGFPKVFEIGRIFRNEGQSREHLQDYTQLETYEAYSDMEKGKKFVRDLYHTLAKEVYGKTQFTVGEHTFDLSDEWKEINFSEEIKKRFGLDPITLVYEKTGTEVQEEDLIELCQQHNIQYEPGGQNIPRTVDGLWKTVRKTISGPAFLTGIPVYLEPLAKRSSPDSDVVERFQVILAGSEIGKGFSELNNPQDQLERFQYQQQLRDQGDDEAQRLDEDYIHAMEYGMPPAFGFGVSERFFAFLENKPVHEAQIFPLLRPKK